MFLSKNNSIFSQPALVAQLDRVSASEVEGHAFESHQGYKKVLFGGLFLYILVEKEIEIRKC